MKIIKTQIIVGLVAIFGTSFSATAEIVTAPKANITQISGYDDYLNGGMMVFLDQNHSACPIGVYIASGTPGAKNLIALTLTAFTASKPVILQVYTDRLEARRCEVDAISILPN